MSVVEQTQSIHAREYGGARAPSFADRRVFVVASGDPRVSGYSESQCWAAQEHDGPIFVVVGRRATDEQLALASNRFGLPLCDLHDLRNAYGAMNDSREPARLTA